MTPTTAPKSRTSTSTQVHSTSWRDLLGHHRWDSYDRRLWATAIDDETAHRLEAYNHDYAAVIGRSIALIEVPFRNTVDQALRHAAGRDDWYEAKRFLYAKGEPKTDAEDRLAGNIRSAKKAASKDAHRGKRARVRGDVVANLTFGFWVFRLTEPHLWDQWLLPAFPGIGAATGPWAFDAQDLEQNPKLSQPRFRLQQSATSLVKLRNAAHHQKVVFDRNAAETRRHLCLVAAAISPELLDLVDQSWAPPDPASFGLSARGTGSDFRITDELPRQRLLNASRRTLAVTFSGVGGNGRT